MKKTVHINKNELNKLFSQYSEEEHRKTQRHKKYLQGKLKAYDKAIQWQREFSEHNYSYGELYEYGNYFYKLGKRYGLLKEFRENGIC
jgi:hypothetical protein